MIVRLKGGLGNQMFQYALGRALVEKKGGKLYLDIRDFQKDKLREYELDKRNITGVCYGGLWLDLYAILERVCRKIGNRKIVNKMCGICIEEKEFYVQNITSEKYLDGYWQNTDYFKAIRPVLIREFEYLGEFTEAQKQIMIDMQSYNSVAMHVRRGDYLTGVASEIYESLNREYYDAALGYLKARISDLKIYIFSDDIEWCKNEFLDLTNAVFVDGNISTSQHIDLELMKNCKHFVIANSTFSWWASWLSDYNDKEVIAPKRWFKDEQLNRDVQQALLADILLM